MPGGRLVVTGWARRSEHVVLRADGRWLASVRSGRLGRFRLVVRPRELGPHRITVETAAARVVAGRLQIRPLVLAAVGDVTFGADVSTAVRSHGPRYPWLAVAAALHKADIAAANLETAVSTRGEPAAGKQFTYRGPPRALRAMGRFAGIDVVSLANNHSLDFGTEAFFDTILHAREAGILTVGGGRNLDAARRRATIRLGGLRVAFLGFSDVRPLGFTASGTASGTTPAVGELIAADVRAAARHADLVVVCFHWGVELATVPSGRQESFAAAALAAGADVVLGSHPHVLQPVERRGSRLVAWSLGNFVFPSRSAATRRSGILLIRLGARGVLSHWLRPVVAGVQPQLSS